MSWFDKLLRQSPPARRGSSAISRAMAACEAKLALEGDANRLTGAVEGFDIVVERDVLQVRTSQRPAERLLLHVRFANRLDVGLRVTRSRQSDPRKPIPTGDSEFDAAYLALADEPERGRKLMSNELRRQLREGPETELSDTGVTVAIGEKDASRIGEAFEYALTLGRTLDAGRAALPAAESLGEFEAAWRTTGQGYALVVERTPLLARIDLGRIPAEVLAVRDGFGQFHFELRARFPFELGVSLGLRPQSMTNEHGRDAEPPNERAFDRLFSCTARDVHPTALFDTTARSKLVMLRNHGLQIRANDRIVSAWMGLRKDDPSAPVRHLWPLAEIADSIANKVETLAPRSA